MIIPVWDLVTYVRSKVGCGYVWGSSGEFCSPTLRQRLAKVAPSQAGAILHTSAKWDGMQVFDCATLVREAFEACGANKAAGATTIWRTWAFSEKGTIGTLPVNEPGIALFRAQNAAATSMAHIGMTIGGGLAVDCRGSANGVLLGPVSSCNWTHWARFADVNYLATRPDLPTVIPGVVATRNGSLNVRSRPDTNAQVLVKLPKGAVLPVYKNGQVKADWYQVYAVGGPAWAMKSFVTVGAAVPVVPPVPPVVKPAPAPVELTRTLRYTPGLALLKGEDVKLLQTRLKALGGALGTPDGVFGPKTKAAVLAFQLDAFPGKPAEWDGVVGAKTWEKLKINRYKGGRCYGEWVGQGCQGRGGRGWRYSRGLWGLDGAVVGAGVLHSGRLPDRPDRGMDGQISKD